MGYKQVYLCKDFCFAIVRYIIDFSCKAIIFATTFYVAWVCMVNWNWFKSAINVGCTDGNYTMITYMIEPFRDMYQQAVVLTIAQMIVIVVVLILDLVHFVWVYRN